MGTLYNICSIFCKLKIALKKSTNFLKHVCIHVCIYTHNIHISFFHPVNALHTEGVTVCVKYYSHSLNGQELKLRSGQIRF